MLRQILAAAVALAGSAAAQTPLIVGTPASGELDGSGPVAYSMPLDAGQFVAGAVDQETVDVIVVVTAPDGTEMLRNDGPGLGPEPFQFETDVAGVYMLHVEPYGTATGLYTAHLTLVEAVATEPEGIVRQMMTGRSGSVPGAVVAVVRDGGPVYAQAFGLANLTHGVPFTVNTRANIGSTSKQFTGFAVALLAQRGSLSLDDDVRRYIPELPDLGETVTLRHLLGHTSGYRDIYDLLYTAGRPILEGDVVTPAEVIRAVQRQPTLQNTPGADFVYNNTGYILLAEVVARIGGVPFPEWMSENVFRPMGMSQTVVRESQRAVVPNSAQGYRSTASGWIEVQSLGASPGASGVYTTAGDLALWMQNLMKPMVEPEAVAMVQTSGTLNDGSTTGYGLGLVLDEIDGQRRVQHGGADTVHRSAFLTFPDLGAGVAVLTNSPSRAGDFADRAIRAFQPNVFLGNGSAADTPVTPGATGVPGDPLFVFDDARFDGLIGRYALDTTPLSILIVRRGAGGSYLAQVATQSKAEISPTSDSTFVLTASGGGVTFHRDSDGVARALTLEQDGVIQRATRLAPDLTAYVGRYWSGELETAYTIAVEGSSLVVRHVRAGTQPLTHMSGETYSIQSGVALEFVRDGDAVTAFSISTSRVRGVIFERED